MSRRRVLLIQVRDGHDVMADHEQTCVQRKLDGHDVLLETRNAVVEPARPEWLDDADALIVGGSGAYSVHLEQSAHFVGPLRALLDRALERDVPGFGICFGHQLLGQHLGGRVLTCADRTEIGTTRFELTSSGRQDPVFGQLEGCFQGQTGHSDHVSEAPGTLDVLARNDVLEAQAFRVRGRRFWSTQFHPDLTGAEARERYLAYRDNLHDAAEEATRADALRFHLAPDPASTLLGRFIASLDL